jgi:mannose-1-phosphate guanylyltransferase/mannose-6-phosphate isomerase
MTLRIVPVIMSGGSGSRLWPLSTPAKPKQFHGLASPGTMIQETAARFLEDPDGCEFLDPIVIGAAEHESFLRDQLAEIAMPASLLVLEPMGRNTAAATVLACAAVREVAPDAAALLVPADHVIADVTGFRQVVARAAALVNERIVTFGVTPDRPETGYGYIERGAPLSDGVYEIQAFHEKPNEQTAQTYLEAGTFYWNAGVFFFKPELMLEEFAAAPDIRDAALAAWAHAERRGDAVVLDDIRFGNVPSAPVDVAVMEQTRKGAVAPCSVGWADIGSWSELWRLAAKDARGNALSPNVILLDGANTLIRADGVTVAAAGVSDLIIVATGEAVLVIPRSRAQDVKTLADMARAMRRSSEPS